MRINKAGCLGRCDDGPLLVVIPTTSGTASSTRPTSTRSSPNICKRPDRRTPEDLTMAATETALINGPDGPIELIIDTPAQVRGIALICHPHPLFHGSNTNKVAHTLAGSSATWATRRCAPTSAAWAKASAPMTTAAPKPRTCWRSSVGRRAAGAGCPGLGGFSFGAYVQTRVAARLAEGVTPAGASCWWGTAAGTVTGARSYNHRAGAGRHPGDPRRGTKPWPSPT